MYTLTYRNADMEISEQFPTRLDAMDAADTAAERNGLTAVYHNGETSSNAGRFVDANMVARFYFRIEESLGE